RLHQAGLDQLIAGLHSEAVDVHRQPGSEVAQPRHALRRAHRVGAAGDRLALLAYHRGAADRTGLGHLPGLALRGARLGDDANDLGDHVARAAQEDAVADPYVLAPQLVLVVQWGPAHGHTAD